MNLCEGTACIHLKKRRHWAQQYASMREDRDQLLATLQCIKASLKLGNNVAAYQTCEKALNEVRQ